MKDIDYKQIQKFYNEYNNDKNNKIVENAMKKIGMESFCLNTDIINRTPNVFNIELPNTKIYDQEDSWLCWLYAGINFIESNIANNLNILPTDINLSVNYLSFFDKLEKANTFYNRIIEKDNFDLKTEVNKYYIEDAFYEGGRFTFFKELVNKYGLVPEDVMPKTFDSKNSEQLRRLYNEKVKKDMFKLLKLKENNTSKDKLYLRKEEMLNENYNLLSKCLGSIPLSFTYEYKDKDGKLIKLENITPIEFKNKYLSINLDDYVSIANVPMYNTEYNKLYRKEYNENIYDKYVEFINKPIEVLKNLAVRQLKDGMPVYFACNIDKMRDRKSGILDSNLYNYKEVFNIDLLTKEEALNSFDIYYQHLMLITGVHIEYNKTIRWKVENSYGDKLYKDGYYIMNDNFFNDFVLMVIINKKYLRKEDLELFNTKPTIIDRYNPF